MTYSVPQLLTIAAIMGSGSIIQSAVGFASGLLGIPLLVLSGFSLAEAAVINIISTSIQNISGAIQLRSEIAWSEMWLPVAVRSLTIPVGVLALGYVSNYDQTVVKQLIGGLLLAIVLLLWCSRTQPKERLAWPWQIAAFASSGFLMGFASIGGGPIVLYVNSVHWSAAKSRAFLFFVSAAGVPIAIGMLAARFGSSFLPPATAALITLPAVMLGMNLGFRLGRRIDKPLYRRITFVLLALLGISAILSPWLEK